jgi:hypothetical protein
MSFDLVPGEEIILRAKLKKDRWMKYRCITCALKCISTIYLAPLCVPLYCLAGGTCREEEADSFELILTNQNLHCKQLLYSCGLCCQQSGTKVIPLEKIQDIALVSDWIGDWCGVVDARGEVYQIHVQTAGMGVMMPELVVIAIDNPREFKRRVLQAKADLAQATNIVGQSKMLQVQQTAGPANQQELSRILNLLERQIQTSNQQTN